MEKDQEKQTILIVDDRRENIVFLANSILKPKGYDIITAMDGEKALHKALEEKPDLIIIDLKMPKMDGLEVLSALREEQCPIPVILTTFHGSESVAVEAFRLGVKDYIIKPYTVEAIEEALERVLEEGRAEEKVQQSPRLAEGLKVFTFHASPIQQLATATRQMTAASCTPNGLSCSSGLSISLSTMRRRWSCSPRLAPS
jgi:DNA-binding NtrC family response regulator